MLRQSDSPAFTGWEEYSAGLLGMCADFADVETLRNTLQAKIDEKIRLYANQSNREYESEALLRIWLGVVREYGKAEEAERLIADNLRYSSFREALIDRYKQENNYDRVVELALEGERQDMSLPGLVTKWQEIRYSAYRTLQRKEEQMELAERLLVGGIFEYYSELQRLVGEDREREALYERLKRKLKQGSGWSARSVYLKLIAEADDQDEMMDYVKNNPEAIEGYAGRLAGKFAEEIDAIYRNHIRRNARSATNRKSYRTVCGMLSRYGKIAGNAGLVGLIGELRGLYGNKSAFMDELNQVK